MFNSNESCGEPGRACLCEDCLCVPATFYTHGDDAVLTDMAEWDGSFFVSAARAGSTPSRIVDVDELQGEGSTLYSATATETITAIETFMVPMVGDTRVGFIDSLGEVRSINFSGDDPQHYTEFAALDPVPTAFTTGGASQHLYLHLPGVGTAGPQVVNIGGAPVTVQPLCGMPGCTSYPVGLAAGADDSEVYWTDTGDGLATGTVVHHQDAATQIVLAEGRPSPSGVAVDGTHVYWMEADGSVWRRTRDDSAPTPVRVLDGDGGAAEKLGSIALDGGAVYALSDNTIARGSKLPADTARVVLFKGVLATPIVHFLVRDASLFVLTTQKILEIPK
jgi:hypothetical protein